MAPPKTFSVLGQQTLDSIMDEAIGGEMREAVKTVASETSCEYGLAKSNGLIDLASSGEDYGNKKQPSEDDCP
jgi:hypothetical protein